jgi:hypothetical protein
VVQYCKVGLMHDPETSREVISNKNRNGTLKTTKIKISAAPVDRERNSPELGAAGFFNLFELRVPFRFLFEVISRDVSGSCISSTLVFPKIII